MVTAHPDCGETVFLVDGEPFDLGGAEHLCRDYVAWHLPADRRHPSDLDVPDGWAPRRHAPIEQPGKIAA